MAPQSVLVRVFPFLTVATLLTGYASAASVSISLEQIDRTLIKGELGSFDLTQGGLALDWLKPVGSDLTFAEKDGAALLTLTAQETTDVPGGYNDDGFSFTWSGGDSPNTSGSEYLGSNFNGKGQNVGFRVTYTAFEAGPFTLTWYGAANNTDRWGLTATLGTATDFQAVGANVGTTTGNGTVDELIWTVTGVADAAGQVLTVDFVKTSATANGAIAITGVTVVPEPSTAALLLAGTVGYALKRRRRSL
ncbi:MAG: PEP-CTERM sorting domain-containing protein [Verrucomicrobiaceae bacterium]|nr:MAG: PEP-CTERM sorting domain-containing protein [Verrucomicrobiaceae bacterium]